MKKFKLTIKTALCLLLVFGTAQHAVSQVTIGSGIKPHPAALLELNQGLGDAENESTHGLLLPRVRLESLTSFAPLGYEHVEGMIVFNLTDDSAENLAPGFYYSTGTRWMRLRSGTANWFYMPTIELDVTPGTRTIDLFARYKEQFMPFGEFSDAAGVFGRKIASIGAPATFKLALGERQATDFYYFVTTSPDDVIQVVDITAEGLMTITIADDAVVTENTFMNIIFVERR